MKLPKTIVRVLAFTLYAPLEIGHYLVTAGDPITPKWLDRYGKSITDLAGDPNWDYLTNKTIKR